VRLSNSQAVSLIQRVLMTNVLRFIMNGGFRFDSANRVLTRLIPTRPTHHSHATGRKDRQTDTDDGYAYPL